MSILRDYDVLAQKFVHTAKRGYAFVGARIYKSLNALHEAILAAPPPGAQGNTVVIPHDHGRFGGSPLTRNNVYSFDSGGELRWGIEAIVFEDWYRMKRDGTSIRTDTESEPNICFYVSPGIDSRRKSFLGVLDVCLQAYAYVEATSASWELRFYNRTTGTYSVATACCAVALTPEWNFFEDHAIPCIEGWNFVDVEARWVGLDDGTLYIENLVISEVNTLSQPQPPGENVYNSAPKP